MHLSVFYLILDILITELQLHDMLEWPEECLVEVEVWKLSPAGQHLCQNVMDERHSLLGYMTLFVTRSLSEAQSVS